MAKVNTFQALCVIAVMFGILFLVEYSFACWIASVTFLDTFAALYILLLIFPISSLFLKYLKESH